MWNRRHGAGTSCAAITFGAKDMKYQLFQWRLFWALTHFSKPLDWTLTWPRGWFRPRNGRLRYNEPWRCWCGLPRRPWPAPGHQLFCCATRERQAVSAKAWSRMKRQMHRNWCHYLHEENVFFHLIFSEVYQHIMHGFLHVSVWDQASPLEVCSLISFFIVSIMKVPGSKRPITTFKCCISDYFGAPRWAHDASRTKSRWKRRTVAYCTSSSLLRRGTSIDINYIWAVYCLI